MKAKVEMLRERLTAPKINIKKRPTKKLSRK